MRDVVEDLKKVHQGRDGKRAATDTRASTTTSCRRRLREIPELDVLPHRGRDVVRRHRCVV